MLSVLSVTCAYITAQVSLTWRSIFSFIDMPTLKLRIIILPNDRPEIILSTACTTKKSSCVSLRIYQYRGRVGILYNRDISFNITFYNICDMTTHQRRRWPPVNQERNCKTIHARIVTEFQFWNNWDLPLIKHN